MIGFWTLDGVVAVRCGLVALAVATAAVPVIAVEPCASPCGDINGDRTIDLSDFEAFVACMGEPPASSQACTCSDLDGNDGIDLRDFALLQPVFSQVSDERPPDCSGAVGSSADLTAYRPQHGAGYAPFARTAVPEEYEESETLGPGIRAEGAGDVDPAGEDDLIEVVITVAPTGSAFVLRRDIAALGVWTTRNRAAGTGIAFLGDESQILPIGPDQAQLTIWVEWAGESGGPGGLLIQPAGSPVVKDALVFHTFASIVIALGGEGQVPSDPPDPNMGTFVVAVDLYRAGYDMHMYDEDHVSSSGAGAVYDEAVTAIRDRGIDEIAIFGYSHGGGSTHDLAQRLDGNRAAIGPFDIVFTSYVDSVANSSDFDTSQELRRPPASLYHLNHYQVGSFFQDLGLDGGPVPNSNPPPTGLNVESTPWGSGSTHFQVDDYVQVRDRIKMDLAAATAP